jgi:hypothetical protein
MVRAATVSSSLTIDANHLPVSTAEDTKRADAEFCADIESFRRQVTHRRKFILSELDQAR